MKRLAFPDGSPRKPMLSDKRMYNLLIGCREAIRSRLIVGALI
ncbi:hypothetical protein [Sphingomonas bacterium]|nr:hypothetical protein [Sphingomonas bacterium]